MGYFLLSIIVFLMAPVAAMRWMRSSQYFNFINLYWLLQCFLILPAAISLVLGYAQLHPNVERVLPGSVIDAVSTFLLLYGIMNMFVFMGLRLAGPSADRLRAFHRTPREPKSAKAVLVAAWGLAGVGCLLFFWKVSQIGGFTFLLANISNRVQLQAGFGPIGILHEAAFWVAILFAAKIAALKKGRASWAISFILILALACITTSIFGGRKAAIQYIVGSLAILSFFRPGFLAVSLRSTLTIASLVLVMFVYFFVAQAYRDTSDFSKFTEDLPSLVTESVASTSEIFMSLSYVDTYVFATSYYNEDNRHYGATYRDLQTAFLPSALVDGKPPVDDGLYVRAATLGYRVNVGSPASVYRHNSWPPETYGQSMMNFGPLSLPIFGLILGAIMGLALKYMVKSRGSDFSLLIVIAILLNFELTNLRIVNLVTFAVSVYFFLMVSRLAMPSTLSFRKPLPA